MPLSRSAVCSLSNSFFELFDRQALPVAVVALQKDVPISDQAYGRIQFSSCLPYGLMYMGGGRIIDRVGTRWDTPNGILWCARERT